MSWFQNQLSELRPRCALQPESLPDCEAPLVRVPCREIFLVRTFDQPVQPAIFIWISTLDSQPVRGDKITIMFRAPALTRSRVRLAYAVAVTADALQILPANGFSASGGAGGPFDITSQSFSLTNAAPHQHAELDLVEHLSLVAGLAHRRQPDRRRARCHRHF